MTSPDDTTPDQPTLQDVIQPTEHLVPDPQQHGGLDGKPNDDGLEQIVEHERRIVHGGDDEVEVPPATD